MNRWSTLANAITRHGVCVLVSVTGTKGSVPRSTDAWMIITPHGFHGTIGGGTLEWKAMAEAQGLLAKGQGKRTADYVLGPDLGQCCGGRMTLEMEVFDSSTMPRIGDLAVDATEPQREVYVFGAGHVGRALVLALAPLPFTVIWADPRPNAFPSLMPAGVKTVGSFNPLSCLATVQADALAFVMTHSHALDLAVVDACLRHPQIAHVGLIGSGTKRARFEKRLREAGVDDNSIESLLCPMGVAGIASKLPAAIAAGVVAQILQLDSALSARNLADVSFHKAG